MYVLGEREGGNSSYGPHATEAGMLAVYPVLLELVFDSEKEGHNGPGDGDAYGKCEKLTKCTSIISLEHLRRFYMRVPRAIIALFLVVEYESPRSLLLILPIALNN